MEGPDGDAQVGYVKVRYPVLHAITTRPNRFCRNHHNLQHTERGFGWSPRKLTEQAVAAGSLVEVESKRSAAVLYVFEISTVDQ